MYAVGRRVADVYGRADRFVNTTPPERNEKQAGRVSVLGENVSANRTPHVRSARRRYVDNRIANAARGTIVA